MHREVPLRATRRPTLAAASAAANRPARCNSALPCRCSGHVALRRRSGVRRGVGRGTCSSARQRSADLISATITAAPVRLTAYQNSSHDRSPTAGTGARPAPAARLRRLRRRSRRPARARAAGSLGCARRLAATLVAGLRQRPAADDGCRRRHLRAAIGAARVVTHLGDSPGTHTIKIVGRPRIGTRGLARRPASSCTRRRGPAQLDRQREVHVLRLGICDSTCSMPWRGSGRRRRSRATPAPMRRSDATVSSPSSHAGSMSVSSSIRWAATPISRVTSTSRFELDEFAIRSRGRGRPRAASSLTAFWRFWVA